MKYSKNMLNILARRVFLSGRIRNLIAVAAIALTAILFTSVTTIGLGTYESVTLSMQLMKGSKSDGDLRNMTAEQFEALSDADFVKEYGRGCPWDSSPIQAATILNLTSWTRQKQNCSSAIPPMGPCLRPLTRS